MTYVFGRTLNLVQSNPTKHELERYLQENRFIRSAQYNCLTARDWKAFVIR